MAVMTWFTSSAMSLRNQWAYWTLVVPMEWRWKHAILNIKILQTYKYSEVHEESK